jgi:hypothetical protein
VTVLPARLLAGHVNHRPEQLSPGEIAAAHRRLTAALR